MPETDATKPAQDADLDLSASERPKPEQKISDQPLDPGLILKFAKQIVLGCAIVGTVFAVMALVGPPVLLGSLSSAQVETEKYILSTGTSLLSVVTTVIPPIITLVLGFYFGKKIGDR